MRTYFKIIIAIVLCVSLLAVYYFAKKLINNPFSSVKDTDIEYITKIGGLPSDKCWAVLFPQKDPDKIKKIINLINSSSSIRESTKDDLEFLNFRHGYPVDITIKMKDGSEFSLKSVMKVTSKKVNDGMEVTGTNYKDRYILSYKNNRIGITKNYTLFSNEAAEYILNMSNTDFPEVPIFSINPENFKLGDKISITGEGCIENEVKICLTNGNDAAKEEYIIGNVKPVFGSWKWEGVIDKNMKTYDGKDISFVNKKLFIEIQIGGRRISRGEAISF